MYPSCLLALAPETAFAEIAQTFLGKALPSERWTCLPDMLDAKKVDDFLVFAGKRGVQRRAVLPGADLWSLVVANRLLKMLEEPPTGLEILVLSVTSKLLPTVASRLLALKEEIITSPTQPLARSVYERKSALRARESLFLLAARHPGHDFAKLSQAADSHL